MKKNKIFDVLFDDYSSDAFDELTPVELKETLEKFHAIEENTKLRFEESEKLFDCIVEFSTYCEKRGFINGLKLGASLMKEMGINI